MRSSVPLDALISPAPLISPALVCHFTIVSQILFTSTVSFRFFVEAEKAHVSTFNSLTFLPVHHAFPIFLFYLGTPFLSTVHSYVSILSKFHTWFFLASPSSLFFIRIDHIFVWYYAVSQSNDRRKAIITHLTVYRMSINFVGCLTLQLSVNGAWHNSSSVEMNNRKHSFDWPIA